MGERSEDRSLRRHGHLKQQRDPGRGAPFHKLSPEPCVPQLGPVASRPTLRNTKIETLKLQLKRPVSRRRHSLAIDSLVRVVAPFGLRRHGTYAKGYFKSMLRDATVREFFISLGPWGPAVFSVLPWIFVSLLAGHMKGRPYSLKFGMISGTAAEISLLLGTYVHFIAMVAFAALSLYVGEKTGFIARRQNGTQK